MEFNFSTLSSHPLFSTIVTLYTLILLYAPSLFIKIVLSPVLNSTGIILLFLLKLGANERLEKESNCFQPKVLDEQLTSLEQRFLDLVDRNQTHKESHQMQAEVKHDLGPGLNPQDDHYKWELLDKYSIQSSSQVVDKVDPRMELDSKQVNATMKFLKWNMKAPLEIIYEAYEGEEEEDEEEEEKEDDNNNEMNMVYRDKHFSEIERYPSLSMYYPESETDSSSDDDFPMNKKWETHESVFFKWEKEDDDREELIEISVDLYEKRSIELMRAEEDNLIEIDIFQERN
ncbi:hypothetical protein HanHA300_Chr16g0616351 [Helianthus annuus]|nr:hypothetical protein HanHA300_Chr16g0616351 [Helianthus annuus]KAJ0641410.1 hypothetical protein HanLR1_Chr16g0626891 [Helianthus annuus]KAJ0645307.1 hypothetical protein HanOQP8_Chr16g0622421 [Helianthus annuus]KAJ0821789.1 hypothetical protein HanPSC8_Chr16g0724321 [Helianthus annuus]